MCSDIAIVLFCDDMHSVFYRAVTILMLSKCEVFLCVVTLLLFNNVMLYIVCFNLQ